MNERTAGTQQNILKHYDRLAAGPSTSRGREAATESSATENRTAGAQFGSISEHLLETRELLRVIVRDHLGNDPELLEIADNIVSDGDPALRAHQSGDVDFLSDEKRLGALEVIVRSDGARPTFLVRNGAPDLTTSIIGNWRLTMEDQRDGLAAALTCVGRINDSASQLGFQGTGSLIGANVVLTNRHVLQAIASQKLDGSWKLNAGVNIDFGHEWRGKGSIGRRAITNVLFAGPKAIPLEGLDLGLLDVALLELAPAATGTATVQPLKLDIAPDWDDPQQGVFITGYPGPPATGAYAPSLLEKLFASTYGHKRVAPGHVMTRADQLADSPRKWSLAHDATTLGGNSGSAILVIGRTDRAAGLHFGGKWSAPRENWGHVIGRLLDETDGRSDRTLRQVLADNGVQLVDGGVA